jgi:thioredoxin reductase (NADPH)
MEGKVYGVIVVGSGPAGLTAAIYTTRGAAPTLVIAGEAWGGQLMLTTAVDNFPGFPEGVQGPDLMRAMRKQVERFGATFLEKSVEKVDFSTKPFKVMAGGKEYAAKAVIIATGAQTVWLDAPGIKEFIGRGVSSCAPCDAPFFKDKNVAVVGGGDSAMEEADTLTKYAANVTVIHRRDAFRASAAMQKKVLENPKVKVLWNTEVKMVSGSEKVEKMSLTNNKTNEVTEMPIDGIFVAIGHKPDNAPFAGQVAMDEHGYIKKTDFRLPTADRSFRTATSVDGVFVAGDCEDFIYKQAITAAGEGCKAALEVLKYLEVLK